MFWPADHQVKKIRRIPFYKNNKQPKTKTNFRKKKKLFFSEKGKIRETTEIITKSSFNAF